MTDEQRIKRAVRRGDQMLGPLERERCSTHRRRWLTFRWIWDADGDISASEPHVVRSCTDCLAEDEVSS